MLHIEFRSQTLLISKGILVPVLFEVLLCSVVVRRVLGASVKFLQSMADWNIIVNHVEARLSLGFLGPGYQFI